MEATISDFQQNSNRALAKYKDSSK